MAEQEQINLNKERLFMYVLKLEEDPNFDMSDGKDGPLYVDYSNLDWSEVSKDLSELMPSAPSSMKFYVGNEPLHMLDIAINMHYPQLNSMTTALNAVLKTVSGKSCKAGVMDLKPIQDKMHYQVLSMDHYPPIMGLFFAIKATPNQMLDHESDITLAFGDSGPAHHVQMLQMEAMVQGKPVDEALSNFNPERLPMKEETKKVFDKHFLVDYDKLCKLSYMGSLPV